MGKGMSRLETMPVSPLAQQTRGCLAILVGATLTFLYLPIAFLILFSFEEADNPGFPITGLTLKWYQAMLSDSAIHSALLNSIEVAVVVAIIATTIGTMIAFPLVRGGIPYQGATRLLYTLPIMIPGVLLGIGLLVFFTAIGLKLGLHTVILGHTCSRRRSSCSSWPPGSRASTDVSNGPRPTSARIRDRRSGTSCCR